jgi:hypothetical protein
LWCREEDETQQDRRNRATSPESPKSKKAKNLSSDERYHADEGRSGDLVIARDRVIKKRRKKLWQSCSVPISAISENQW